MAYLEEVFEEIYKHDVLLNLEKCTFRVGKGKFLGFMITHLGIEANPKKGIPILEMDSPTSIQKVQKLNGKLASLSRFLPKLVEKAKPFYKLLKKFEPFLWDEACEQAFLAFKKTIVTPLVLSRIRLGVPLLLYLSVIDEVVSLALV